MIPRPNNSLSCEGAEAVDLLREMARVAPRRLVSDLRRGPIPYATTWTALHLVSRDPVIRHDGPLSICRGFVADELERLGQQAGWDNVQVARHRFFRFALIGTAAGRRWATTHS